MQAAILYGNKGNDTIVLDNKTYELEWYENFDSKDSLENKWWCLNEDFGESRAGNGYHIWASENNFNVENGSLVLKANVNHEKKNCAGATIQSTKLFEIKDTMWEMKFKVSKSLGGDWFVFLLLPHNKQGDYRYPLYDNVTLNEITPIELQSKYKKYRSAGYFYDNFSDKGNNMDTNRDLFIDDNFYNQWHILKFVWDDDNYYCYMDDVIVYEVNKNEVLKNIPDDDLYGRIYIGADMMGEWSGTIDINMKEAVYYVDYIKIWKKK